jgi:hypothetical protein
MIPESRDSNGKLRVGYFVELGRHFKSDQGNYDAHKFKAFVENSGVLQPQDWKPDGNYHKHTWKHRVERATQKILTGI